MSSLNAKARYQGVFIIVTAFTLVVVYWLTAYRTITWWKGCSFPLTALTLGVDFPPGSLLLTILGWLISKIPLGLPAILKLNMFSGIIAISTIVGIVILVLSLVKNIFLSSQVDSSNISIFVLLGIIEGSLVLAWSYTMWHYTTIFQPYTLTALFTVLIIGVMWIWWKKADDENSWKWLFLALFLFGLDFSVHRTNSLLLPGLLVWILLRKPKTFVQLRSLLSAGLSFIIGLSFQLLIIPIAARQPIINANDPSNFSRFYNYVSLKQYGGGWLVSFFPRKAPFINVQLTDYLKSFKANFLSGDGVFGLVACLSLLLAIFGVVVLWRKNWRLSLGLLVLFFLSSFGAVVYFNVPNHYFWPMDRHYLASYVIFTIMIAFGAGSIITYLLTIKRQYKRFIVPLILLIIFLISLSQLLRNYHKVDASHRTFAYDYAQNVLKTIDQNAILIITGENYFPLLYLQAVEHIRPDVTILSLSLLNTSWYVKEIINRYADLPLTLSQQEVKKIGFKKWKAKKIPVAIEDFTQKTYDSNMVDSIYIHIEPTVAGKYIWGQDWVLIKLLQKNKFRRPIYFSKTPSWLKPYVRREGLVGRIVSNDSLRDNCEPLRKNLFQQYTYRGYANPDIILDKYTKMVGQEYFKAFIFLAQCSSQKGDTTTFKQAIKKVEEILPPKRINISPKIEQSFEKLKEKVI